MSFSIRTKMKTYVPVVVCSLFLVSSCSGSSSTNAPAPEMTGVASTVVHNCPYKPGFSKPIPVTMPSTISTTYGVHLPSGASFFGVEGYSPRGAIPYFFVGPVGASCSVIYAGDGGEDMSAIDSHDNATISEELYPSGVGPGDEIVCYAFPDIAGDIEWELGHPCPKYPKIATWDLTKESVSDSKKLNPNPSESVGLAKMAPGDAPKFLSDFDGASRQYTTWQLSLDGLTIHWIACSVPQKDAPLCAGVFEYFLAETSAIDGVVLPTQSAIDVLIRNHIQG